MRQIAAVIIGLSLVSGAAQAADVPELTGLWSGAGPAVGNDEGWETARSNSLRIDEQRGPVFRGHVAYEGGEDDFVGVVRADGRSILISDDDGNVTATLLEPNRMELCYIAGGDDAVALCSILTRADQVQ